uniref:Uncharacterized protein n=1 Tax=Cacopsylla melanoneura TaxID=428564 RepID=A0A8D8LLJ1_9HEMI
MTKQMCSILIENLPSSLIEPQKTARQRARKSFTRRKSVGNCRYTIRPIRRKRMVNAEKRECLGHRKHPETKLQLRRTRRNHRREFRRKISKTSTGSHKTAPSLHQRARSHLPNIGSFCL